ncbi:dnaj [Acrasis kona]|uniref:Dnaj n=1 Tax=Acrasis kona TaxID=1008807 RepID=A0AAW2YSW3_9EUKA
MMNGRVKKNDESCEVMPNYNRSERQKSKLTGLTRSNDLRLKLISMGDVEVGKSCLIKRYCEHKFFPKYLHTIGVDFGVKNTSIDGHVLKINFWDLSGHEVFFEVRNEFYKDAQGAILVYDVNVKESFHNLDSWVAELKKYGGKASPYVVVCANKIDSGNRVVSEKDGRDWAARNDYSYFETSAQTGEQVEQVFEQILKQIMNDHFR